MLTFVCHKTCTTCAKAREYLNAHGIAFAERDIQAEHPTKDELARWLRLSGYPIKRLFNTSGMKYREMNLSAKVPKMTEDEALELLSTDGMLVKRPVLIGEDFALFGFKESEWSEKIK